MFLQTPALVGIDVAEAIGVSTYLRQRLGLDGPGQLAAALMGCAPMLMYHAWDNLDKKVRSVH